MGNKEIMYFDYMATTPCDPDVISAMHRYMGFDGIFGNPASQHHFGTEALKAVENARAQVACAINASPEEIVWTSGASESDNLAIKGAAEFYKRKGNHIITLATEHKAVLDSFHALQQQGFECAILKPRPNGLIDLAQLSQAITPKTVLVSVMHVNNEIGVVQPIADIASIVHKAGALLHVDAAQSMGKIAVDVKGMQADLVSISGHKAYGPKGIGALYVSLTPKRIRLNAQQHGGGHERGMRSGTLPTHQIVGMGKAFELASQNVETEIRRIASFAEKIYQAVMPLGGVHLNGCLDQRVKNNLNFSFEGIDGEALKFALSSLNVSSSSACASANIEPSYVIKSLGVPDTLAYSTIRLSLGRFTTMAEVDKAIEVIRHQVIRLRALYCV